MSATIERQKIMAIKLTSVDVGCSVDLGTIGINLRTSSDINSDGGLCDVQLFFVNSKTNFFKRVNAPAPIRINAGGLPSVTSFTTTALPVGTYDRVRVILFVIGSNYSQVVTDTEIPLATPLIVDTNQIRVIGYEFHFTGYRNIDDKTLGVSYILKYPKGSTPLQWNGAWFELKGIAIEGGNGGFIYKQDWSSLADQQTAPDPDPFLFHTGEFAIPTPAPGVYLLDAGSFNYSWQILGSWLWHGLTIEIGGGSWVTIPTSEQIAALPPKTSRFGAANFGNAIQSQFYPSTQSFGNIPQGLDASYFAALRVKFGYTELRLVFNSDGYLNNQWYRDLVRDTAGKMIVAGVKPQIGPQQAPAGGADVLVTLNTLMANEMKGLPYVHELCNEPGGGENAIYDYSDWSKLKPILQRCIDAVRAVKNDQEIIAPTEGYSKSAAAAALSPLATDPLLSYSVHAYISAAEIPAAVPAGIPIIIQEFYAISCDAGFYQAMVDSPATKIMPWAATIVGDDTSAMVASFNGGLTLTVTGENILKFQTAAIAGHPVSVPPVPVPPTGTPAPPTPAPPTSPSGGGGGSVVPTPSPPVDLSAINTAITDLKSTLTALTSTVENLKANVTADEESAIATKLTADKALEAANALQAELKADEVNITQAMASVVTLDKIKAALSGL